MLQEFEVVVLIILQFTFPPPIASSEFIGLGGFVVVLLSAAGDDEGGRFSKRPFDKSIEFFWVVLSDDLFQ